MALATGTQAPLFTLKTKTADGLEDISLADNFGKQKTVLLFFPLAFTSVCMDEMCDVSAGLSGLQGPQCSRLRHLGRQPLLPREDGGRRRPAVPAAQ